MILLLLIGFVAGIVTALSPCVLPVLPVILTAGAARPVVPGSGAGRWAVRPLAIAGGLVVSFGFFTLFAGSILSALGLPPDLLRDAALVLLGLVGVGLVVPPVGEVIERPFSRLATRAPTGSRSGFVLGLGLGLVFVPCAGPILTAMSVAASTHRVGGTTIALTATYCLGAGIPLFAFAALGDRASEKLGTLRQHAVTVRRVAGLVLLAAVVAIWANLTTGLQTALPGYTSAFQKHVEGASAIAGALHSASGAPGKARPVQSSADLSDGGRAPNFVGITAWLNTPGDRPLTTSSLHGHVVLVDFWTYSCINCRRSLPHVEAWYSRYHAYGLDVVGVETPEFSFEHVVANVASAARQLGVDYPVAVDDNDATWNAYRNQYWPAEYLIDARGEIRHYDFGEGNYGRTEDLIRELLTDDGVRHLPPPTGVPDRTPTEGMTPESYLGYNSNDELQEFANRPLRTGVNASYSFPPSLLLDQLALSGRWQINAQESTPASGSQLEINFTAEYVYLVMSGSGTVGLELNGHALPTVAVTGVPNLYPLVSGASIETGILKLTFTGHLQAWDFTFG